MSNLCDDMIENINLDEFFEREVESWRSKMVKVFGDQHPYTFYVTDGHDFEDMVMKITDIDAHERESRKYEPFENLEKMTKIDKKAEEDFYEILSKFEKQRPTPELKEALEQKKKECAEMFDRFDNIVSICEDYFELEYSDCRKRVSKHIEIQEPIIKEVEKFLIEVEEFGNAELKSLQDRISKWIYNTGFSMLHKVDKSYDYLSNQPFAMSVWFECSAALTSKEIRHAFLADQKEMCNLWKKAFNDLPMLSAKLEKCRCNYNLMKFKLEREIFWMNRDYKENMPELTKIQRHLTNLIDEKIALKLEMKILESEIRKERKRIIDGQNKMYRNILNTKANNKFAQQTANRKFQNVLNIKKEEIYTCLAEVIKGDQFIHEEILGASWNSVDLSVLKPNEDINNETDLEKPETSISQEKISNTVDDFSSAFEILKSSENFVTLLNMLSDELGYILDFTWVNYIKKKLELTQEVKWLELFKVFKINFVEDLRELKEHMTSYCKFDDGQVIFDINEAVDGFSSFVWKKRQSTPQHVVPSVEYDAEKCKNYWSLAKSLMPKSLLWENVEQVLVKYWELLESRSTLLKSKFSLLAENQELENYLQNYHKYRAFNV